MDGEAWQEVGAQIETGIMGDLQEALETGDGLEVAEMVELVAILSEGEAQS